MVLSIVIGIIVAVCIVSALIAYVFMHVQNNRKSSIASLNEKQQINNPFKPTMDTIIKKLKNQNPSNRISLSSNQSVNSSTTGYCYEENEVRSPSIQRKSTELLNTIISPHRSTSMVSNMLQMHRPRNSNWRQGAIVDPQQMALIQFTLPPNNKDEKYRRRSVAICNNIIESKENPLTIIHTIPPCLLSFSIIYFKNSQLKIKFNSLQSLPNNIQLHQLTIKVKLFPDGKEKSIQIRKLIQNDTLFNDEENEIFILFSNIQFEKLHEKSLLITIYGKDQTRKTINLGQIGKINFNQIKQFENENQIDFIHEIEKIKPSSIELLVSLQKRDDQHIHIDLQRIKGLKIDQKKLDSTGYLQILLIDHHYRTLITKQTKSFRLNSSNLILDEQYNLNIITYDSNNLDRFMIIINLYSNSNPLNEYKHLAHIKLSSPLFCSGSGTIHWQQFKARESFSMWHTLNKQQH